MAEPWIDLPSLAVAPHIESATGPAVIVVAGCATTAPAILPPSTSLFPSTPPVLTLRSLPRSHADPTSAYRT